MTSEHDHGHQSEHEPHGHDHHGQDHLGHGDLGQDHLGHGDPGQDHLGHGDPGQDHLGHGDLGHSDLGHGEPGRLHDAACEVAHGRAAPVARDGRVLVAVFATPAAQSLLRYAADAGYR